VYRKRKERRVEEERGKSCAGRGRIDRGGMWILRDIRYFSAPITGNTCIIYTED
jgi:hypothetical protein